MDSRLAAGDAANDPAPAGTPKPEDPGPDYGSSQQVPSKRQIKVFVDTGTVYRKEPAALEESQETLTSIGVGFSALFSDNYFLDIELAKPTNGRAVSDGNDDGRIWANLTMKF